MKKVKRFIQYPWRTSSIQSLDDIDNMLLNNKIYFSPRGSAEIRLIELCKNHKFIEYSKIFEDQYETN